MCMFICTFGCDVSVIDKYFCESILYQEISGRQAVGTDVAKKIGPELSGCEISNIRLG